MDEEESFRERYFDGGLERARRIVTKFNRQFVQNKLGSECDLEQFCLVLVEVENLLDNPYEPKPQDQSRLGELADALKLVEEILEDTNSPDGIGLSKTKKTLVVESVEPDKIKFSKVVDQRHIDTRRLMDGVEPGVIFDFIENSRFIRKQAETIHSQTEPNVGGRTPAAGPNVYVGIQLLAEYWNGLPGRKFTNTWQSHDKNSKGIGRDEDAPTSEGASFIYFIFEEIAPDLIPSLFRILNNFRANFRKPLKE